MIKVYSKENCPQCVKAKTLLKRHGYSFEEVRIDEDDAARNFLLAEGHRSVPQLYVDEMLLVEGGFAAFERMTTKQIALRIREINGN
jgi:glutaredoxin 3